MVAQAKACACTIGSIRFTRDRAPARKYCTSGLFASRLIHIDKCGRVITSGIRSTSCNVLPLPRGSAPTLTWIEIRTLAGGGRKAFRTTSQVLIGCFRDLSISSFAGGREKGIVSLFSVWRSFLRQATASAPRIIHGRTTHHRRLHMPHAAQLPSPSEAVSRREESH